MPEQKTYSILQSIKRKLSNIDNEENSKENDEVKKVENAFEANEKISNTDIQISKSYDVNSDSPEILNRKSDSEEVKATQNATKETGEEISFEEFEEANKELVNQVKNEVKNDQKLSEPNADENVHIFETQNEQGATKENNAYSSNPLISINESNIKQTINSEQDDSNIGVCILTEFSDSDSLSNGSELPDKKFDVDELLKTRNQQLDSTNNEENDPTLAALSTIQNVDNLKTEPDSQNPAADILKEFEEKTSTENNNLLSSTSENACHNDILSHQFNATNQQNPETQNTSSIETKDDKNDQLEKIKSITINQRDRSLEDENKQKLSIEDAERELFGEDFVIKKYGSENKEQQVATENNKQKPQNLSENQNQNFSNEPKLRSNGSEAIKSTNIEEAKIAKPDIGLTKEYMKDKKCDDDIERILEGELSNINEVDKIPSETIKKTSLSLDQKYESKSKKFEYGSETLVETQPKINEASDRSILINNYNVAKKPKEDNLNKLNSDSYNDEKFNKAKGEGDREAFEESFLGKKSINIDSSKKSANGEIGAIFKKFIVAKKTSESKDLDSYELALSHIAKQILEEKLQSWIDDNLAEIVKKIVEQKLDEIVS